MIWCHHEEAFSVHLPTQPAGARHRQELGSSTGLISLVTRACCQDEQVCSCCYGDKLGPKAGFSGFFLVFARETEQLTEEAHSLSH